MRQSAEADAHRARTAGATVLSVCRGPTHRSDRGGVALVALAEHGVSRLEQIGIGTYMGVLVESGRGPIRYLGPGLQVSRSLLLDHTANSRRIDSPHTSHVVQV